ncbi:MAG: hypothetical protein ACLGIN_14720 [Candidatus Sericytochromatia bacterium]
MTQRFANDPHQPGGLAWETFVAERRIQFLESIGWPEGDPETVAARARLAHLKTIQETRT